MARRLVEMEVKQRAQAATKWPKCSNCGQRLRSKGFRERQLTTWLGVIRWQRRVGRCPNHCIGQQRIPLDEALGIKPYQQTAVEVERLGCLLSIFVPFELAAQLMSQMTGLSVSASSLWSWVQQRGKKAAEQLEIQLKSLSAKEAIEPEVLEPMVAKMILVMAVDGVMVPMRSQVGTAQGKTRWLEVKVGVLARLGHHLTRTGKTVTRLNHRRLVAVLGNTKALAPRKATRGAASRIDQCTISGLDQ